MSVFTELLGPHVVNNKGEKTDSAQLASNEVVGDPRFTVVRCGPCRQFTPFLIEVYKKLKAAGKKFELIFVSGDHGAKQFNEYFATMPWLAVPFEDREVESKLSGKYEIEGIPTLILLDNKGEVLSRDGRAKIAGDPEGARFPWRPQPVFDMFDHVVNHEGAKIPVADVRKDATVIGLYFSAHWCGPCRAFTPQLAATYKKLKAAGKKFEIIFVSSDRDEAAFKEYFHEMPWLALPFANRGAKGELSEKFEVQGIPTLVLLHPDGKLISADGREELGEDPEGANFPWLPQPPKPLELLNPKTANLLNTKPCIVALIESLDAGATAAVVKSLEEAAGPHFAGEDSKIRFLYADASARGIAQSVRNFLQIPDASKPALFVLNIPRQAKHMHIGEVTGAAAATIAKQFADNTLQTVPIRA